MLSDTRSWHEKSGFGKGMYCKCLGVPLVWYEFEGRVVLTSVAAW